MCFPDGSTLVEHQNRPSGSSSSVQASYVLSPIVNGNWQATSCLLFGPDSVVVLQSFFLVVKLQMERKLMFEKNIIWLYVVVHKYTQVVKQYKQESHAH